MKDLRQTPQYAQYLSSMGWEIEKDKNNFIFVKKIPLIGNIIKIQRPQNLTEDCLGKLAKKYKPFQIIVEPKSEDQVLILKNLRYKQASPFVPAKTILIDLKKSTKSLLSNMHQKTRYNIRHSQKNKDLIIKRSNKIQDFSNLWHDNQKTRLKFLRADNQIINLYKSFGSKADLVLAYYKEELVAGVLLISTNSTIYYMYARSTEIGKKLFAPTALVSKAIEIGKKRKLKYFDFEGIYDDRFPIKSWLGFTKFKKSFGGKEITYPGAFTKTLPYLNINFSVVSQNRLAIIFIFIGVLTLIFSLTNTDKLVEFAKTYPLIAPFLIILWRIIGVVIPPIPGGLLSLAMIPVFGWFQAYLYGAIGLVIGCCMAFWLSRRYGEGLVKNFIPLSQIHKLEKKLSEADHFFAFLLVRFTTGPVMDFASYVAGLTKVKFSTFLLATIISILPDALYYYLGDAIYRSFSPFIIIGVIAIIGSLYLVQKLIAKNSTSKKI